MKYVIKLEEGYYSRDQTEFCWGLVDNINEAQIFYDTTEVDQVIAHGLETKQEVIKNGYTVMGVDLEIKPNTVLYRQASAEEVDIVTDVKITKKDILEIFRRIDPNVFDNHIKSMHDAILKTKAKFKELSYVSPEKMNRPFTR